MTKKGRKRKLHSGDQGVVEWDQVVPFEVRRLMKSMWEIPQIFQFLLLTKESLGLPDLSMYEMERMFLIPRASKQMAQIMTSVLKSSVSVNKTKLKNVPLMPYEFWNNILACKIKNWFRIYDQKHGDAVKVLECTGIEPQFWNVFPHAPLMNDKDFEDLSLKQRVWLLKTVCDTLLHLRKTVQDEITKQPCENLCETVLGTDRHGARYIYFPQFLESDLRVYRHCLDNNILSSVKPRKKKMGEVRKSVVHRPMSAMEKAIINKRRWRWKRGLPPLSKKTIMKTMEQKLRRRMRLRAASSLINEDTNLSSTSSCGNNNNSNSGNNNMNLDTVNEKECSEMSMECDKAHCKNAKSSGYDTDASVETTSDQRPSQKTFQGFSSTSDDEYDRKEMNGFLGDLKSETVERKEIDDSDVPLVHRLQNKLELRRVDNLSNVSKTDDEKLNEIISAECLKLNGKGSSHFQVSTISKSDDEKLNETRTDHNATEEDDISFTEKEKENQIRKNGQSIKEQKPMDVENDTDNSEEESNDEKDLYLNELRSMLQGEAMEDDGDSAVEYNDRKTKNEETRDRMQAEDFYQMLLELSVSKFQLVADSVNSLKRLISSFSKEGNDLTVDTDDTNSVNNELIPSCEVELVRKLKELLSTVEKMESALLESARRAKEKLQKEWINFKKGSVENHDSSGEGLNSNWWVVGSQGCPLPGAASPRTLSQSTLPSACPQEKDANDASADQREDNKTAGEACEAHQSENKSTEARRSQSEGGEGGGGDHVHGNTEINEDTNEEEQQSRRVLRARGISSYTEQLYSDEDVEENELQEWTDIEAVYAAPNAEASDSAPHLTPKAKPSDDRTNEEDSDQDWILPSSRRRKAKRPSASRRLKSFQHKLQTIKVDELQAAAESVVVSTSTNEKGEAAKPKIKDIQICNLNKPVEPQTSTANSTEENQETSIENNSEKTVVPSMETSCKVETIESVHSELDIKDEGPIYDSTSSQFDNNYTTNINPNYVMLKHDQSPMSYYVMQPNSAAVVSQNTIVQQGSVVPNIMPPLQQGYYVQGEQNYIIQAPQTNFISPHTFQSQGPQMIAPEQFVNHPGYVPYMMTAPQSGFVATNPQIVTQGVPQTSITPVPYNPAVSTRFPQARYPIPRQQHLHPNGAVIRSNVPIRGNSPRSNVQLTKNVPQQRGTPVRPQKPKNQTTASENAGQKPTSLIVLSDSDDEIEVIIPEKTDPESEVNKAKNTNRRSNSVLAEERASPNVNTPKTAITPQIIQRMNQGGISITPVRAPQPVQNPSTQLVVVVNETGSHYALALPNGGKLILTNEQVAQIRASNGGKLIL